MKFPVWFGIAPQDAGRAEATVDKANRLLRQIEEAYG
jgi:hypothetical protein